MLGSKMVTSVPTVATSNNSSIVATVAARGGGGVNAFHGGVVRAPLMVCTALRSAQRSALQVVRECSDWCATIRRYWKEQ